MPREPIMTPLDAVTQNALEKIMQEIATRVNRLTNDELLRAMEIFAIAGATKKK